MRKIEKSFPINRVPSTGYYTIHCQLLHPENPLLRDRLWDEPVVEATHSWSSVPDRHVSDRELAQVVANHVWLDLNKVEHLAVVDTNHRADHLRKDDLVAEVGLHWLRAVKCTNSCFDNNNNNNNAYTTTVRS